MRKKDTTTIWSSPTRLLVSILAIVTLVIPAVIVTAIRTEAAPGPDPLVEVGIEELFDGTGFGSAAQTFVNTANGFVPGDDGPNDGVVSSNDDVGYQVTLAFQPGPSRRVAFTLGSDSFLEWPLASRREFCQSVGTTAATLRGDQCVFSVRAGASSSTSRTIRLVAKDTAGHAEENQRLALGVGLADAPLFATINSAEVTVVSAPSADLVLWPGPDRFPDRSATLNFYTDNTGFFEIIPRTLVRPGFSPVKGVSAKGPWSADVDVSAFPPGTQWWWEGRQVFPEEESQRIRLREHSGSGTLTFEVPQWPADHAPGATEWYDISIAVDPTSFSTVDYLNNGTGHQPGDGLPAIASTLDAATGAIAGFPHPNNDWSAARVFRPLDPPGQARPFTKTVTVPRNRAQSIHESGNMFWDDAATEEVSSADAPSRVSPGTQTHNRLDIRTDHADMADGDIIVVDTWDPAELVLDTTRSITVTGPDGLPLSPGAWTLQWSPDTVETRDDAFDVEASGWFTSVPPREAAAVRAIIPADLLPRGPENEGAGPATLHVWTVVPEDIDIPNRSHAVDTMFASAGGASTTVSEQRVEVVPPRKPVALIDFAAASTSPEPGHNLTFTVTPGVQHPPTLADGFTSTVTVVVDRCLLAPVNTSDFWDMEISGGIPGPSGRVCGDEESVPLTLTFTPRDGAMSVIRWDHLEEEGWLPSLSYQATLSRVATGLLVNSATLEVDGITLPVSRDLNVAVSMPAQALHAEVRRQYPTTEVGDPIRWEIHLGSEVSDEGSNTTIIALPKNGDGYRWEGISNKDEYLAGNEPDESNFLGSYHVSAVELDRENTTVGTQVFFTTDSDPSLNAEDNSARWYALEQAGEGGTPQLAGATALKVVTQSAGTAVSVATVALTVLPDNPQPGNVFLVWAGESAAVGTENAPAPWPAAVTQVVGAINGIVWEDANNDALRQSEEDGIAGVEVGLHRVASDQTIEDAPLDTVTTDQNGAYHFGGLRAGNYVVRVGVGGDSLPMTVDSHYGQTAVDQTYSYSRRTFGFAQPQSTVIALGKGRINHDVNFGFFTPSPLVDIDKSAGVIDCDPDSAVCDVSWEISLTNLGDTVITAGSIADVMSDDVYDVRAGFGEFQAPITTVVPRTVGDGLGSEPGAGAYAVSADGKVYSWGVGRHGANGHGSTAASPTPVLVQGLDDVRVVDVVAREGSGAYALTDTGEVYSWGKGESGANGNGVDTDSATAVKVVGLDGSRVINVVARGERGAYALDDQGHVFAWGDGAWGANGNDSAEDSFRASRVLGLSDSTVITSVVDRAGRGGYALSSTGSVYSWGTGDLGSNGNGRPASAQPGAQAAATNVRAEPVLGLDGVTVTEVVARGREGAYARTSNGEVYSWGNGIWGSNGNGGVGSTNVMSNTAQRVVGLEGEEIIQVFDRGESGGIALSASGRVFSWGSGAFGGNGNDLLANTSSAQPVRGLEEAGPIVAVAVRHSMGAYALDANGFVYSWGVGRQGANGNGSDTNNSVAGPVIGIDGRVTSIEADGRHGGSALTEDGQVFTWGWGERGANGTGTTSNALTATRVLVSADEPLGDVINLVSRGERKGGCALTSSRSVFAWGPNADEVVSPGSALWASEMSGLPGGITITDVVAPVSTERQEALIKRVYRVNRLPVGETLTVILTGKVTMASQPFNVLNQVWFTSPSTPITGIGRIAPGQSAPNPPEDPGLPSAVGSRFDPLGIPGNPTCDTKADEGGQDPENPDSCDQVPVFVPSLARSDLGSISGTVWLDPEREGNRPANTPGIPHVEVHLLRGETIVSSTSTNAKGEYSFPDLVPFDGYRVKFGVLGMQPSDDLVAYLGLDADAAYSFAFTPIYQQNCIAVGSCVDPATSTTPAIVVGPNADVTDANAGVIIAATSIEVVKTSETGDPAALPSDADGFSEQTPVRITIRNNGDESVTGVVWEDTTEAGPELKGLICTADGGPVDEATVVEPGATIDCEATLEPMEVFMTHRDTFTATATGVLTGVVVADQDSWEATVDGNPSWTLEKTASLHSSERVPVGGDLTYTLQATNTGNITMTGAKAVDDLSGVLAHAQLREPLAASVELSEGSTLVWNIPDLNPGASATVSYTVRVNPGAWNVTLVNSVYGEYTLHGLEPVPVPPAKCAPAAPCSIEHRSAPQPSALTLPRLGGRDSLVFLTLGAAVILCAATAVTTKGRRHDRSAA